MVYENWHRVERKETISAQEAGKGVLDVLVAGAKIYNYWKKNEKGIDQRFEGALEQMKRHPSLFVEIATGAAADVIGGYHDEQRQHAEDRTKIRHKTANVVRDYRQRVAKREETERREQETARASTGALEELGQLLAAGINEFFR